MKHAFTGRRSSFPLVHLSLLLLILWGCFSAFPALSEDSGETEIIAEYDGQYIHGRIYDPDLASWKKFSHRCGSKLVEFINQDGIIAWYKPGEAAGYAYDAGNTSWQKFMHRCRKEVAGFSNRHGVVSWHSGGEAFGYVYNPQTSDWKHFRKRFALPVIEFLSGGGVVAWYTEKEVYGYIFNPATGLWSGFSFMSPSRISGMSLENRTVTFSSGEDVHIRGYDFETGLWYKGPTKP
jgi:hypothetical protein